MQAEEFQELYRKTTDEVAKVVLGQRQVVEHCLTALIARGHILLEGVPGLGKTLLVRSLSEVLGCRYGRIQFTPDLMPSDVTGSSVYSAKTGEFEFLPGPVFSELLLADEINRAPAKTQSALLEAMQERSVTTDGKSRKLPDPFLVLATQNPVESQGTYPLPEAQLDRFLLKVDINYPDEATEKELLSAYIAGFDPAHFTLQPILDPSKLRAMQALTQTVEVNSDILDYITTLVRATRDHRSIDVGASPRASVGLLHTARTIALSDGRSFVLPDDVKRHAHAVLRHRLVLHPDAELEGVTPDEIVDALLAETPVPGGVR